MSLPPVLLPTTVVGSYPPVEGRGLRSLLDRHRTALETAVADQLRAGVVWANTFNKFDPTSPFGGYKQSGYGREGGRHGLAAYLKGADQ